jgi:DNA polymerase-3 subunit gamma/tau
MEKVHLIENAARLIAIAAESSLRDAESILGQIIAVEDKEITEEKVEAILGLPRRETVLRFFETLLKKDAPSAFSLIHQAQDQGHDLERLLHQLTELARTALIMKINPALAVHELDSLLPEEQERLSQGVAAGDLLHIKKILESLLSASEAMDRSPVAALPLELAALEISQS